MEEERRLFYVGITRTKESLHLSLPLYLKGKLYKDSPFLKECGIDQVEDFSKEYDLGIMVQHSNFGKGEVISMVNREIEIKFADGSIRAFDLDVLISHKLLKKLA